MKITLAKMSQNILYCIYIHKYHLIFLRFYIKSSKTEQRKNTTKTRALNKNSKNSFINLLKDFGSIRKSNHPKSSRISQSYTV